MPQFGNKDKLERSDITLLPASNPSKTMQLSSLKLSELLEIGKSKFFFATFYSNRPTVY